MRARFAVRSVALVALGVVACGWLDTEVSDPDPTDLKVLFIGSSYFASNDMPAIFAQLAGAAGKQVYVGKEVIPGYYLDYFAASAQTEAMIESQQWDYVILQGGCQNAAYPETHHLITPNSGYHPVFPALETLTAKIRGSSPSARTVYMMPWAFEDGMTWVEGQTDTYADMQLKIRDNTQVWADSLDIILAPVGLAWYEVLTQGDPPVHYLHVSDWNHPSYRGSYLSANVIFASVFAESAEGVAYYGVLDQAEAEDFQAIASHIVLDDLSRWNILPGPS